MTVENRQHYSLDDLLYLMKRLRDPQTGCPWDVKQNYLSITPSTLEEAYEVVDAIEKNDIDHLREELGDLLFQVIFYSRLAEEENRWTFVDIVDTLTAKLIRRHPHVFPGGNLRSIRDASKPITETDIKGNWEAIKQKERAGKGKKGLLDDIPQALPALRRAEKLQKRTSKVGFDWPSTEGVLEKLNEEVKELNSAMNYQLSGTATHTSTDENNGRVAEELGDVLFSCVNLARHLKLDSEQLLRAANRKFEKRFTYVEQQINAAGRNIHDSTLQEMDLLWEQSKGVDK